MATILYIPGGKKLQGYLLHHQLIDNFLLKRQPKMRLKSSVYLIFIELHQRIRDTKSVYQQLVLKNSREQFMNFHSNCLDNHLVSPSAW